LTFVFKRIVNFVSNILAVRANSNLQFVHAAVSNIRFQILYKINHREILSVTAL